MRVVADTNVVVSGILWRGAPRQILEAARTGRIDLYSCADLLLELEEVLHRQAFMERLQRARLTPRELILGYAALVSLVRPPTIPEAISADPDDDIVLACALTADADFIVSGDRHLLQLGMYNRIQILDPAALLLRLRP